MLITQNIKTITDMRQDAKGLLGHVAKTDDPIYIFSHSKPQAVMLNLHEFNKLQLVYEDYLDSLEAQEFEKKNKTKINWLTQKQMLAK